jgi:hypothetical protein
MELYLQSPISLCHSHRKNSSSLDGFIYQNEEDAQAASPADVFFFHKWELPSGEIKVFSSWKCGLEGTELDVYDEKGYEIAYLRHVNRLSSKYDYSYCSRFCTVGEG